MGYCIYRIRHLYGIETHHSYDCILTKTDSSINFLRALKASFLMTTLLFYMQLYNHHSPQLQLQFGLLPTIGSLQIIFCNSADAHKWANRRGHIGTCSFSLDNTLQVET